MKNRTTLLLFSMFLMISGIAIIQSDTSFRKPTVNEIVKSIKTDIMEDLVRAMMSTENLGKIEAALLTPCAKVYVSSKTVGDWVYWGVEADYSGCKEK